MKTSKSRHRSKGNRNRSVGNIVNRVFESMGPEGKVRGTPQQIIDKYNQLARDAQLSNDRVATENFQQHSEHYTRMLSEALREQEERRQREGPHREDRRDNQSQGAEDHGDGQRAGGAGDRRDGGPQGGRSGHERRDGKAREWREPGGGGANEVIGGDGGEYGGLVDTPESDSGPPDLQRVLEVVKDESVEEEADPEPRGVDPRGAARAEDGDGIMDADAERKPKRGRPRKAPATDAWTDL